MHAIGSAYSSRHVLGDPYPILSKILIELSMPCIFSVIAKRINCCKALEHLKSSGTKSFMSGPIVRKLCKWRKWTCRNTDP